MWFLYAVASAVFAGVTSILVKCGLKRMDSTLGTAIRTVIVLIFSWIMVFVVGSQGQLTSIPERSLVFLMLSGLATGASWLCYFKALQLGDVNKVVPIDKSSGILTIILAIIFFGEKATPVIFAGIILLSSGTFLMIERRSDQKQQENHRWLLFALGSAFFASMTSILAKVGITGVESNLGTAIRTCVVLVMSWTMVFVTGAQKKQKDMKPTKRELVFLLASGLATGISWLCYYRALQDGPASIVVPIDKLSILITIAFSSFFLHERLTRRAALGLALMTAGTLIMVIA